MNFLQLAQRARQEMSVGGNGPSTVVNQTGELKRVVDWVAEAWMQIQRAEKTWRWMRKTMPVKTITSGVAEYSLTDLSITDLAWWYPHEFSIYLNSIGATDERPLYFRRWEDYRYLYVINTVQDSYPYEITIRPDNGLALGPGPNATYKLNGEYQKKPTAIAADADIPDMPEEYHFAIVWLAVRYYGEYESASEAYSRGERNFKEVMSACRDTQLPSLDLGGPLF